ncbi:MAG: YigZ family protein [Actinomycetota bacterium]|nr:YigZ family protein [Actinomycetota bacterium]
MSSSYLTIARDGDTEIEVRRSRFLCRLRRVESEEDAREVVGLARKQHWDAHHHCSAYILGPDARLQRSNDDGEPAGTAGAPMLDVLRGREVSDVVAVVTRWFGGTLLGAGGLVRAYSDAVRACLDDVGVVRRRMVRLLDVTVGHADAARLQHELQGREVAVRDVAYGERATLRLAVPDEAAGALEALIAQLTGQRPELRDAGTDWVDDADHGA